MKIVVLDDDPTGSQTVHGCLLLLSWEVSLLRKGLRDPSPFLFVIANTRALMPEEALSRNRLICNSLKKAMAAEGIKQRDLIFVSRGDSTLRGHGFLEPKVIAEELGPFDATIHVPAFLEGGRTTIDGVHLLNGQPVHNTVFARDRLFGYSTSDLAAWLEEKSNGAIPQQSVVRISLEQLDDASTSSAGQKRLEEWLSKLRDNKHVIVDAEYSHQLDALGTAVRKLMGHKKFLFRSAASLLNGLSKKRSRLLSKEYLRELRARDSSGHPLPGIIMVGSHVSLADAQIRRLLETPNCEGLELSVRDIARCLDQACARDQLLSDLKKQYLDQVIKILDMGKTPVLYTTRGEVVFSSMELRMVFGQKIAEFMGHLAGILAPKIGYLISKGGITTLTLLSQGLELSSVYLEGQILPGLSLVMPSEDKLHNLPVVTFPGNLGGPETLFEAWLLIDSL
ncbi:four-carbon acid sugar kinase family protein [Prochlorococcus sp. MIT 1300]|uniref:four-carbon acid sugar kinase family protein n=1 Tax=Prochlorococcus sp. MIT 1300 TaxID=3096218 RepID=UPI002A765B82|nr:four-carbon acid sugar kinase family protein [Prochlorococcus sp. MIT 1300]